MNNNITVRGSNYGLGSISYEVLGLDGMWRAISKSMIRRHETQGKLITWNPAK